jgi:hypothetical protein
VTTQGILWGRKVEASICSARAPLAVVKALQTVEDAAPRAKTSTVPTVGVS